MPALFEHLKQRKLGQWGLAYLAGVWVVLQVLDVVADPLHLSDTFQQGVLIVILIGLPLTLVLAWYHGEQGRQRVTGPELLMVAALLGLAGVAVGFLTADVEPPGLLPSERDELAVAVLPFATLGPDAESEYFSEAITDELIGRLSRIEGVTVVSRTSVARFKGTELDVKEIAAELGATHVFEGAVRKAEERVRVTAQLTDASSGFEEWSDVFSGESDDWFALHEEVALEIAEALNLHLSPTEAEAVRAHYTGNTKAYDAFWRGWVLLESFHADVSHPEQKVTAAEEHFERALRLDPEYALAVAGLSIANSFYYFYGVDRTDERRDRAEGLARRALAIDPALPEAHVALGQWQGNARNHLAAVDAYREALRLGPDNAVVWCFLAYSCNAQDPPDPSAAEQAALEAIRSDPTWTYSYYVLGWALELQGRYNEAVESFKTGAELNPDYRAAHYGLGRAYLELGNYGEAVAALRETRRLRETGEVLIYIGAAHAGLRDVNEALAAVEQGLARGFRDFDAIEGSPHFATLRDDPRLQALLEKYRQKNQD